jgi:hypothetical protein
MDKGYTDYLQYAQWGDGGIYFITRMKDRAVYEGIYDMDLLNYKVQEISEDKTITLPYPSKRKKEMSKLGRVLLWDDTKSKFRMFVTNSFD